MSIHVCFVDPETLEVTSNDTSMLLKLSDVSTLLEMLEIIRDLPKEDLNNARISDT